MNDAVPPEQYASMVGKYFRMTTYPSSVTGVVIDEMCIIENCWTRDGKTWCFTCLNMLPIKNPKHSANLQADRFIKCYNSKLPYESKKTPLGTNRIIPCTLADIRQRRNELKIKKVMGA